MCLLSCNCREQLSWGPAGAAGNQAGPGTHGGNMAPGQALSVVTTVWGVTNTSQSGPFNQNPGGGGGQAFTNTTMSGGTPYTPQQQGYGNPMQKGGPAGGPVGVHPYNTPHPVQHPGAQAGNPGAGGGGAMPPYNRSNSAPVYNKK